MTPASEATGVLVRLGRRFGKALLPASARLGTGEDWALWRAAIAGDEPSARRLVQHLTPQATGLAMQMLCNRDDAEDVVQESLLRLWNSRPSDAHGATLATYFNTIVINRCRSWLTRRKELGTDHGELIALADGQQMAAEAGIGSSDLDSARLQACMARLPARQRMALAMWAYADADAPAIAHAMDIEPNAAHQLLYRARMSLKSLLQEHAP